MRTSQVTFRVCHLSKVSIRMSGVWYALKEIYLNNGERVEKRTEQSSRI